jgi:hypothetical protein
MVNASPGLSIRRGLARGGANLSIRRSSRGRVAIGLRTIVILPDRNVDVGDVGPDEIVVTKKEHGPHGEVFQAFKMKRDDPEATSILDFAQKGATHGSIF